MQCEREIASGPGEHFLEVDEPEHDFDKVQFAQKSVHIEHFSYATQ